MKWRKLTENWNKISSYSRMLLKGALILSCVLLTLSLLLVVYTGEPTAMNIRSVYLYAALYRAPLGVLFLSSLGAVLVDDASKR